MSIDIHNRQKVKLKCPSTDEQINFVIFIQCNTVQHKGMKHKGTNLEHYAK